MGLVDAIVAAGVLGGASWLLYRTLFRRGGACCGCSQAGACRTPGSGPVQLGRPPDPPAGGRGACC